MDVTISLIKNIYSYFIKPLFIMMIIIIGFMAAAILYHSIAPKIEFGSLPDWISTACSVATFIVALLAFKAAPHWIKQKIDESALNLADNLIDNIIAPLDNKLVDIHSQMHDIFNSFNSLNAQNYNDPSRTELISALDKLIKELRFLLNEAEESEIKLTRKGWLLKSKYSVMKYKKRPIWLEVTELDLFSVSALTLNFSYMTYFMSSEKEDENKEARKVKVINAINDFNMRYKSSRLLVVTLFKRTKSLLELRQPLRQAFK